MFRNRKKKLTDGAERAKGDTIDINLYEILEQNLWYQNSNQKFANVK